jgi:methylenetetrahydrofolate reductase (NADPH)
LTRANAPAPAPAVLADFLRRPRLEVMPLDGVEPLVLRHVPRELTVTVTSSPTRGIEATLELAESLTRHGYRVVPHVAARLVRGRQDLATILSRIEMLGSGEVFVVAGDVAQPAGPFEGAAALLAEIATGGPVPERIGVTGYPESHAFISDETTIQAMFDKVPFATYIVSQICFDAAVIAGWIRRVRERGVDLPIFVGLPGPTDALRLLRLSGRIGLGESARFLRRHGGWLGRLTLPRAYRPEQLLECLAAAIALPANGVEGLHMFTFNEIAQEEQWRRGQLVRLGAPAPGPPDLPEAPGPPTELVRHTHGYTK